MKYWVWLQNALGYGSTRLSELYDRFGSAVSIYRAHAAGGVLSETEAARTREFSLDDAEKVVLQCQKENIGLLPFSYEEYPFCLKNISNPPAVLYYRGILPDFSRLPSICIVGSRKVSDYGSKCAYSLAGRLAKAGFVIVSGCAVGCDKSAHIGALSNDGLTVAVLGNGFGANYLKINENLRKTIAKNGSLLTEFRPYTKAYRHNFPLRNRILSGLALGTVVVEAGIHSGALITANCAAEQNRDVFVIPGSPGKEECAGSNRLLQDGAKPVIDLTDIIGEYLREYADRIDIEVAYKTPLFSFQKAMENFSKLEKTENGLKKTPVSQKKLTILPENQKILSEHLSKNAKIVYNYLDKPVFTCDDLLTDSLDTNAVLSALGELEIYGYVTALPGGRYQLV